MRNGQNTKNKIDKKALGLFVKKGVRETTIKDIANAAEISEGAMYRHYASKEELANELFHTNYTTLVNELNAIHTNFDHSKERIAHYIHHYCTSFDNDPTLYSYLLLSQHNELKKLAPNSLNAFKVIEATITEGVTKKEIPNIDPAFATTILMGIVLEMAKSVIYGRLEGKMLDHYALLRQSCLNSLGIK